MLSFETRPAILPAGTAPVARGLWCWPALLSAVALVLDAVWPLSSDAGTRGILWLELAALACLGWSLIGPRSAPRTDWATPVDGRILSGFMLAILHVVRLGGAEAPTLWLRHITAAGVCFYALGARLRREPRAPDAVWPAFALITLALSAHTLSQLTAGVANLEAASSVVDLRWESQHGLAKTLLLATLLCAGRASELGARALWRVTALVGALACGLLGTAGGAGLGIHWLANLDEPFYFGTSIVAFMLLAGMTRMAWALAHERPQEAGRWRATALMFPLIAALLLFGGTTGGEGVRLIGALAGAAVIAARVAPRAIGARQGPLEAAEPARARAA